MLDIKRFEEVFGIDETNNTRKNSLQDNIKVFPFTTNKDIVDDFYLVLGAIIRNIAQMAAIKTKITTDDIENIVAKIKSFLDEDCDVSDADIQSIIKDIYFSDGVLKKNSSVLLKYAESNNNASKVAAFLQDVLLQDKEALINKIGDNEIQNVLDKIFYKALPKLEHAIKTDSNYYNLCPAITKVFQEDFEFLINDKEFSIDNLVKLLEFYYFTYTSQALLKLNHRMNGEKNQIEEVYFALDWEKISTLRKCVDSGYKLLVNAFNASFMNVVLLQIINCWEKEDERRLDYIELKEYLNGLSNDDRTAYKTVLLQIFETYKESIKPEGKAFTSEVSQDNEINEIVDCFFEYIKFQVAYSERKAPAKRYTKEFKEYTESAFVKFRGKLGQSFNLTDDYLIFITKICLKNAERMRLIELFKELEKRGIFFDTTSKDCIVKFYERLNILEKKSDSGVVQYVKRI